MDRQLAAPIVMNQGRFTVLPFIFRPIAIIYSPTGCSVILYKKAGEILVKTAITISLIFVKNYVKINL
jgi:hypothetical protein